MALTDAVNTPFNDVTCFVSIFFVMSCFEFWNFRFVEYIHNNSKIFFRFFTLNVFFFFNVFIRGYIPNIDPTSLVIFYWYPLNQFTWLIYLGSNETRFLFLTYHMDILCGPCKWSLEWTMEKCLTWWNSVT